MDITDPLNQSESYTYDDAGNIASYTDRKGQVTQYTYDALDRLSTVTYDDNSTITYTYDAADRVTQIVDSLNGTLSYVYDGLDRLTQVTTLQGVINYTYYANGLRHTMSAGSQPTITYSYDNGNRLLSISQAAGTINNHQVQTVSFTYDAASRPATITYPNGIVRTHSYDAAGQLTGISYAQADSTPIGDLTYAYDHGGRRIQTGGSLARTELADDLASATFNADNRLTATTGPAVSYTYDANGNMTSDGTHTYVWNARNQLVQIQLTATSATLASYTYDALGRRSSKTIGSVATGYVYDGMNIAQELTGVTVSNSSVANLKASYLSGGVDQVFARNSITTSTVGGVTTTSGAIASFLTDALGSTLRLTDGSGAKLVDYTYDAYGNTLADALHDNPIQYTGRENDGNGMYYYRARYYSPTLARFISRDPIGLAGGINTFAYVGGNPVNRANVKSGVCHV